MKHNTLSLSLLLSAALVVPSFAMAELIDHNQASVTADNSTMPTKQSIQEDETDLTPLQPSINNSYQTKSAAVDANTQELDQQNNAEEHLSVTPSTDYAAPQDPEVATPIAEDDFQ